MQIRKRVVRVAAVVSVLAWGTATSAASVPCPSASFGSAVAVPGVAGLVVAGHFDPDGTAVDLAGTSRGSISFFRREAAGSLEPLGLPVETGLVAIAALHAADLDGNGLTDLVVSGLSQEPQAGGLVALLNVGTPTVTGGPAGSSGTFGFTARPVISGTTRWSQSLASADLDGNGKLDLVVAFYYANDRRPSVSVFAGNGDGTFRAEEKLHSGFGGYLNVAVGDVNGDGHIDIVALTAGPSILQPFLGNGSGGFTQTIGTLLATENSSGVAQGLALADFDRDGHLDAAVGSTGASTSAPTSNVRIHAGNENGTYLKAPATYDAGPNPADLAAADLNRDTFPDLVAASVPWVPAGAPVPTLSLEVFTGSADGRLGARAPLVASTPVSIIVAVTLSDLDSDGAPEILSNGVYFPNACAAPAPVRTVPIVLDVTSGSAHYVTELAVTNRSPHAVTARLAYTPSLGMKLGEGVAELSLAPGQQRRIDDALGFLRSAGLSLPSSTADSQQGGTLSVEFEGLALTESQVAVTARTASLTGPPLPAGRAGLAYTGVTAAADPASAVTLFPLRAFAGADRTNLAVFNTSDEAVTFRVTLFSASGDGRTVRFREAETLPAHGWIQYGSAKLLDGSGLSFAWARVERTSAGGSMDAYAVINDIGTNDGSFVPPVAAGVSSAPYLTVPVLVETGSFLSELFLVNTSATDAKATLRYVESAAPATGAGGTLSLPLPAGRGQRIPDVVDYLRRQASGIGPRDGTSHVGSLRIDVEGVPASAVLGGVRVASQAPGGAGQFGLYLPAVHGGSEARTEAHLYGLRSDSENRTNVAALNAGAADAGAIDLSFQVCDGDAGGAPAGVPLVQTLTPGQWTQPPSLFKNANVRNGWVRVTRLRGTAPWIAYGVVNDGGNPNERTGDGAYVPMVR